MLLTLGLLMAGLQAIAQQTVRGNVKDSSGEPLIGVTIVASDGKGTVTDLDGNFSLQNVSQNTSLTISYIGYVTQKVKVGGNSFLNIIMKEDNQDLDEVVVVGYQTMRRRDLTGSVASVTNKQVTAMPVANAAQALQGKMAGVNVTSQDGRPDAAISIRVRGGGSITQSNDPLVLIDGVAGNLNDMPADQIESIDVLKDASSTAIYGARGANGVVLVTTKGAKEGRIIVSYNGYLKVNTPMKYMEALAPYDYLAYTWASGASVGGDSYTEPFEKLYGIGRYTSTNPAGIEAYKNIPAYEVQKDVYKSSFSHNHDLTISGGTDRTKVLLSAGYTDEDGMKLQSYLRRASFGAKISQKINKSLDIALDARYIDTSTLGSEGLANGSGSLLSSSYRFRPIATENILGDLEALREGMIENYAKQSQWDRYDPVARINDTYNPQHRQVLRSTFSVNWNIIKGLAYHTDISYNSTWNKNKNWTGAIVNGYINDNTGETTYAGNASISRSDSWAFRWSNTLNYNFDIAKIHHFNILAGHEISNSGGESLSASGTYFPSNFTRDNAFAMINQYDASKGVGNFSSSKSIPNRIISYFGRLNYTLLDRYLFTFTFRADGSSKFAPSHRWGYFPAAAIAWRLSDEPFMSATKSWMDNLKLRLSYGEVGNDGIDSSLWSQLWSATTDRKEQAVQNGQFISSYKMSEALANSDLKWETTITRNFGVDFGFFKSRLTGSVDLYWNTTKDLLMETQIPGITGFTSTYANIGQTSNKGVEITLQGVIVSTKDLNITAGMNISFNKSNVDELADNVTGLYGTTWGGSTTYPKSDYILKEGHPVGLVRGLRADGYYTTSDFNYANGIYTLKEGVADISTDVFPNYHVHNGIVERPAGQLAYPGMAKFKDLNGDGIIDSDDIDIIGDMTPVHTGGFNVNATYKGFDLGLYFNWSYGNEIYNANKMGALYGYKEGGVYENKLAIVKDCYRIYDIQDGQLVALTTPEQLDNANANAKLPLAYSENAYVSDLCIEDGSYLRLNTLTLGYTLPRQLTKRFGISSLRVYGSVYNVFTITGYDGIDPEVSTMSDGSTGYPKPGIDWGTYPRPRSFIFGINVNF